MKTLYIVRHAKSLWDNYDLSDHERPISEVGVRKTKKIINDLNTKLIVPDVIISSSAVRAFDTAKLIAVGIGYDIDGIVKNDTLYNADIEDVYSELFGVDNAINSVMIVGHNPTLTDFVNDFVTPQISNLPTTGVVSIDFKTESWEKIDNAKFKVNFVVFPRMLP